MSVIVNLDVQIASDVSSVPQESEIRSWLEDAISAVLKEQEGSCEVAVRIVDETEGRELNRRFRQQDKSTNVLSFPAADNVVDPLCGSDCRSLGDIVICAPLVEREAAQQGKQAASHWGHLLLHGTLHLLGYDHQTEEDATQMEALERQLLASRGIEDPYVIP